MARIIAAVAGWAIYTLISEPGSQIDKFEAILFAIVMAAVAFFYRVFGLTVLGSAAVVSIAAVYGVLQAGAFREVTLVVVLALGVLLAAASMMGSASDEEVIKR